MSDFRVTHVAPREGLQAWREPDPSVPAVADVQAGVQMQLLERRGAWARVLFSNGWSGWVDGRRMVEAAPAAPAAPATPVAPAPHAPAAQAAPEPQAAEPAPATPRPDPPDDPFAALEPELRHEATRAPAAAASEGPTPAAPDERRPAPASGGGLAGRLPFDPASVRPIPALLGAGAVLLGTFFAWITIARADGNAYDVPLEFLWNHRSASGGGLKVGLLLLALAGAVGALCFLPEKVKIRRILGGAVLALTLIYIVQLQRALSAAGDGAPGLISALGFGVLLTLLGGAAIVYDPEETALRD